MDDARTLENIRHLVEINPHPGSCHGQIKEALAGRDFLKGAPKPSKKSETVVAEGESTKPRPKARFRGKTTGGV